MKLKLFLLLCFVALNSFAQTTIVGTVKDSVTGSNIMSGSIEFIPIDTPKTNALGEILFGYKTVAYINDGKFSAVLTEGQYDCIIGPFNVTKPITVAAGTNVVNLATIYGNTDNSLVTFFQFYTLSNALASMITGSVSGVATFNGRSGAVTLTSNDVYAVDIAAEKIKFTSDAYIHDTNVLAFAVLSVDSELSAATNSRSLIVQSLGVDPATNAVNSITNKFATTNYVNDAVYNATNGLSTGSSSISITKTLFIDAEFGNDSTALRGRLDKPFKTISAANNASFSGDILLINTGSNYISSTVYLNTNISLIGFGHSSKIYGGVINQALIGITNSGITIKDVYISAVGTAIGYIGTTNNLAYATNISIKDVYADGGIYAIAWTGEYIGDENGHTVTAIIDSCKLNSSTNEVAGVGIRFEGASTNTSNLRLIDCEVIGCIDSVILGGCTATIEGGRYTSTSIDGITAGNYADVTVINSYVRSGPVGFDLYNDGYPTSILKEHNVDYITPTFDDDDEDKITHIINPFSILLTNNLATIAYVNTSTNNFITTANAQALTNNFATKVYAESLTNNFATTNFVKNYVDSLTVTNSGDSSISLSNITAVYVLSIKSNTTISPFLNVSASEFRSASLLITNGIGSNCTVKLPDGTSCLGGTTLTVTNAQRRIISVGGFINFTNAVSQALP